MRSAPVVQDAAPDADEATAPARLAAMQKTPIAERDWNTLDDAAFRGCARHFFAANLPAALAFQPRRLGWAVIRDWYLLLSREGWLAATWPPAHGGMGLSAAKLMIYHEEMQRVGAPRLDHGINNLGSILLARGTEEQVRTYLPRVLSGEHIWCGLLRAERGVRPCEPSYPGAAGWRHLRRHRPEIWTTLAHQATHMYALVRTDAARPGRDGISFLLIDLRQPGVRPSAPSGTSPATTNSARSSWTACARTKATWWVP